MSSLPASNDCLSLKTQYAVFMNFFIHYMDVITSEKTIMLLAVYRLSNFKKNNSKKEVNTMFTWTWMHVRENKFAAAVFSYRLLN